jgi:hypothetical protein
MSDTKTYGQRATVEMQPAECCRARRQVALIFMSRQRLKDRQVFLVS